MPEALRDADAGIDLELRVPQAIRPWQHVLEPLAGYLKLAEAMERTIMWHRAWRAGDDMGNVSSAQIADYGAIS